ncbi:CoA pyrophosphatase [Nonlabens dokdonensis]|uniref:NUDIX hydrolase n=1 Tax=Nonlabens dokdonensis TaxID=328515 RepID=UPI0026EAF231|nr:CoA pyrophosphatase [Nonlabens dokdonensis]
MTSFQEFLDRISKLKNLPLPGLQSQLKMAAVERLDEMRHSAMKAQNHKEASVMMLVYPKNDIPHFVLIERAQTKGKHSGQIAFPGGRKEKTDVDNSYTALRETEEEIGISIEHQHLITSLTSLYIPPSNYMVYPYLAFAKAELQFKAQPSEVKSIIEIELAELLKDQNVSKTVLSTSYMKEVSVPCFYFGDVMVWGATAMMLQEIKDYFLQASGN